MYYSNIQDKYELEIAKYMVGLADKSGEKVTLLWGDVNICVDPGDSVEFIHAILELSADIQWAPEEEGSTA